MEVQFSHEAGFLTEKEEEYFFLLQERALSRVLLFVVICKGQTFDVGVNI